MSDAADVPIYFTIDGDTYLNEGLTNAEIARHHRKLEQSQPFAQKCLLAVVCIAALSIGFVAVQGLLLPPGNDVLQRPYAQVIVQVMPWLVALTLVWNMLAQLTDSKAPSALRVKDGAVAKYWERVNPRVVRIERTENVGLLRAIEQHRQGINRFSATLGTSPDVPELGAAVDAVRGYLESYARPGVIPATPVTVKVTRRQVEAAIKTLEERELQLWSQIHRRHKKS